MFEQLRLVIEQRSKGGTFVSLGGHGSSPLQAWCVRTREGLEALLRAWYDHAPGLIGLDLNPLCDHLVEVSEKADREAVKAAKALRPQSSDSAQSGAGFPPSVSAGRTLSTPDEETLATRPGQR